MYQIRISAKRDYGVYLDRISEIIGEEIKALSGVFALGEGDKRESLCVAVCSENKSLVKKLIADSISSVFVSEFKRAYFSSVLNFSSCDRISYQMLINTLTVFNSSAERFYAKKRCRLTSEFNLDGFYDFTLRDLRSQWTESAATISSNSEVLRDEECFNVMLKFLLSGIDARIKVVYLDQGERCYYIKSEGDVVDTKCQTDAQLLVRLAELAPEKIIVAKRLTNEKLMKKIGEIFCLKVKK